MFKPEGFSLEIFKDRYAFTENETWEEACHRVSKQIAMAEQPDKVKKYEEKFFEELSENRFVPGGRIWYNSGRPNPNLLNCFVLGSELDSREGWGNIAREMIITSMCGGGCGCDFSDVRPRGAEIAGQRGAAPGAVELMKLINNCAEPIRSGGNRRCLPMGSLIHTKRGLIRIEEINTSDFVQTSKGYFRVLNLFNQGEQETIKIITKNGELECTSTHKIAVITDIYGNYKWKLAKDLQPDDLLYHTQLECEGIDTNLPPYVYNKSPHAHTVKNITIPKLDTDISWLFGLIHGDGYVSIHTEKKGKRHGRVNIACSNDYPEIKERAKSVLSKFGINVTIKPGDGKLENICVTSVQLAEYFYQFKQPHKTIIVPDFILQGSNEIRAAYICGLMDADGSSKVRPLNIASSIYPDYLRQCQSILASLGICSIIKKVRDAIGNWKILYHLSIIGSENINKFNQYNIKYGHKNIIIRKKEQCSYSFPGEWGNKLYNQYKNRSYPTDQRISVNNVSKIMNKELSFSPIPVIKIEVGRTISTYDIEVEQNHEFIVNGYLVHNCALMFSLNIYHPDIMEFLESKLDKKELNSANISVRCKDVGKFIKAVKNDEDYILSWKGKYKKTIKARDLWNKIVQNAYNSAEPGFLNLELINSENTISYLNQLVTTNPCGEIPMESYGSCCLGHVVLSRFVKDNDIDWHLLANTIRIGVRLLDNVLSINTYPLEQMKVEALKYRRIGLGTTALADTLAMLGYRYGSEEGNKFVDKLFRFISKQAYEASIMLAIEKGPFQECHFSKHVETGFVKRMPKKIKSLIEEHGIRNCAILTQAPSGTVSILSGNCSSGMEPMFAPAYERTFYVESERKTELVVHPLFRKFIEENKSVNHFVGASDLTVKEHMEVQKIVQYHIDNAVSKTINIPENYPIEDMAKMWLEYMPYLKGVTFYRENSRKFIGKDGSEKQPPLRAIPLDEAIRRVKNEDITIENTHVDDCPNGVCDISKKK